MTTNLLWAFPDIPFNASTHTLTDKGAASGYDKSTVISGSRSQRFLFDTTNDAPVHLFDLGASYTSLQSKAEYLIVSNANLTQKSGSTAILLDARTGTGGGFTSIVNDSWDSADLKGPNSKDYIITFSETSQYRQWQVSLNGSNNTAQFPHSQIYFGLFFDFGRDPHYVEEIEPNYYLDKGIYQSISLQLTYKGLTNATREDFESKIGKYASEHPIFLYTQSYHSVLLGQRLLNCRIRDYNFTYSNVSANQLVVKLDEVF